MEKRESSHELGGAQVANLTSSGINRDEKFNLPLYTLVINSYLYHAIFFVFRDVINSLELKMNWFCKFCTFFQSLYIAEVSHPTIYVLQVEDFEDGILAHLGIKGIDDTALRRWLAAVGLNILISLCSNDLKVLRKSFPCLLAMGHDGVEVLLRPSG